MCFCNSYVIRSLFLLPTFIFQILKCFRLQDLNWMRIKQINYSLKHHHLTRISIDTGDSWIILEIHDKDEDLFYIPDNFSWLMSVHNAAYQRKTTSRSCSKARTGATTRPDPTRII